MIPFLFYLINFYCSNQNPFSFNELGVKMVVTSDSCLTIKSQLSIWFIWVIIFHLSWISDYFIRLQYWHTALASIIRNGRYYLFLLAFIFIWICFSNIKSFVYHTMCCGLMKIIFVLLLHTVIIVCGPWYHFILLHRFYHNFLMSLVIIFDSFHIFGFIVLGYYLLSDR